MIFVLKGEKAQSVVDSMSLVFDEGIMFDTLPNGKVKLVFPDPPNINEVLSIGLKDADYTNALAFYSTIVSGFNELISQNGIVVEQETSGKSN